MCGEIPKAQKRWLPPSEGGGAVSTYQIILVIFAAMGFIVTLIGLMIVIIDMFSKRK